MNEKEKQQHDNYFNRLQSILPKGAELISAKGSFGKGVQSATFVYKVRNEVYKTTLTTEGGFGYEN